MAQFDIGSLIAEARRRRNLSLREVSQRTGLTVSRLSRLERGAGRRPSDATLMQLADILGMPQAYLLSAARAVEMAVKQAVIDPSGLGGRIAWARQQQGLSFAQAGDQAGVAEGDVAQLERGQGVQLTSHGLERLAGALAVTVAFLAGTDAAPGEGFSPEVGDSFIRHVEGLPAREREWLEMETVEVRFGHLVQYLCDAFPALFTPAVLAYHLGLSLRGLQDILQGFGDIGGHTMERMSDLTGVPMHFFATGRFAPVIPAGTSMASITALLEQLRGT